jgi:peptidyl-Asp metalloendopeptidase
LAPAAAGDSSGARALRPITWGIERPAAAGAQKVAYAAGATKALPRQSSLAQHEIVIDVLVAYTRKAGEHYHDISREVAELAIEQANHSFRLSGIGHIRLRLVHAFQTGYTERGGHFEHVWHMADRGDEHMERIHALREQHRADIAVLIVDDSTGCGLATRIGADADEAFAVVHHECAVTNYTIAHEIGHLIGARHELAYVSGNTWRDIMSNKDACGGCPRLPVWSNPTVLIAGEPAGTNDLNNASVIAANAWRVASFK